MSNIVLNMPGIIPVAGMASEFGMEWDSSLIPVGPDYTAIEASIYECLHAGCSSIWIVANDDVAPLLKHRVGEWATDFESITRGTWKRFGTEFHRDVPIYYVPILTKHQGKIDNYAWSALYGCNVAYWIMLKMSRWTTPKQYYVSFPMGILDPKEVFKQRPLLRKNVPFYFSYEGKTVKDGQLLSFVIGPDEWRRAKHVIITNSAVWRAPEEGQMPTEKLPPEERLVSLGYGLEDVFGDGPPGTEAELKSFYDLTTWDEYVKFISSDLGGRTRRPSKTVMYRGRGNK